MAKETTKILVVGTSGCGVSALVHRLATGEFDVTRTPEETQ